MNTIQLKGKLTSGAPDPAQLAEREACYVIPDKTLYIKNDDATLTLIGGIVFAQKNSPAFTGTPTAPTPAQGDNSTRLATTEYVELAMAAAGVGDMLKSVYDTNGDGQVDSAADADALGGTAAASYALQSWVTTQIQNAIDGLIASAPGALDTLNELAAALGDDPNFATTVTNALATKLDANSTIDGGTI